MVFEDEGDGECAGEGPGEGEGECLGEGGWGVGGRVVNRLCTVLLRSWLHSSDPGLKDQLELPMALILRAPCLLVLPQLDCRDVRLVWTIAVRTCGGRGCSRSGLAI